MIGHLYCKQLPLQNIEAVAVDEKGLDVPAEESALAELESLLQEGASVEGVLYIFRGLSSLDVEDAQDMLRWAIVGGDVDRDDRLLEAAAMPIGLAWA